MAVEVIAALHHFTELVSVTQGITHKRSFYMRSRITTYFMKDSHSSACRCVRLSASRQGGELTTRRRSDAAAPVPATVPKASRRLSHARSTSGTLVEPASGQRWSAGASLLG